MKKFASNRKRDHRAHGEIIREGETAHPLRSRDPEGSRREGDRGRAAHSSGRTRPTTTNSRRWQLNRTLSQRGELTCPTVSRNTATRPLSKLSPEVSAAVRTWGATHARPAGKDPRRMQGPQVERLQA